MRIVEGVVWLLLLAASFGCAIAERDNRRLLNGLDAELTPDSTAAKWALSPVTLPVGLGAGAIDAFIVHPATVIDDAWGDTVELLWTPQDESPFRQVLFAPFAALATPVVFAGDWLGRSAFAIPPRRQDDE